MRRKTHAAKAAAALDRKVLRRRILRVLENAGTYDERDVPTIRSHVALRIAALVRELKDTR